MAPEPVSVTPQPDVLMEGVCSLRAQLMSAEPWPEAVRAHTHARSLGPRRLTSTDDSCGRRREAVAALVDAVLGTLQLHVPRPTPFLGAPPRCAHDNQTWPCRTRTRVETALVGVVERDGQTHRQAGHTPIGSGFHTGSEQIRDVTP